MLSTTEKSDVMEKIGSRRVFSFADAFKLFENDDSEMKDYLGGKGAGLAQMTASGVNVPPGLTILTLSCREYSKSLSGSASGSSPGNSKMPDKLMEEVFEELIHIEKQLDRKLGDLEKPLLLSVRSKILHARYDGHHFEPWSE